MKGRKTNLIITIFTFSLIIFGCGQSENTGNRVAGNPTSVEEIMQLEMEKEDNKEGSSKGSDAEQEDNARQSGLTVRTPDPEEEKEDNARQSGLTDGAPEPEEIAGDAALSAAEGIDVDLTMLSSTMVYSEVYNMLYEPQDYIGKTVKMGGNYAEYYDETTGNQYFACIIQDAAACCAQGIEFVPTSEYRYPDNYPKAGEEITVVGVFDTYMEGDEMYCTLRNASF